MPRFGNSKSVEAVFCDLSRPMARDGSIRLRGHLLDGYARKISRTARSTIAGEVIALANAVDLSLRLRSMMIENLFRIRSSVSS